MRALAGTLSAALVTGILAAPAVAGTFEPTRFDDPVPGKCKPDDCSLREAISAARKDAGTKDIVLLDKGRYKMELPDDGNDTNENGDFDVFGPTKIIGQGAKKTIVDGDGIDRVFTFLGFDNRTMKGLTITGGNRPEGGGGLFVGPSKAKLSKVVIKKNVADDGAGIRSVSPNLTIVKSTITRNSAPSGTGGGILIPAGFVAAPVLNLKESTLSLNEAEVGAGLMLDGDNTGGGDDDPGGVIFNSTIARNDASDTAGGIGASDGASLNLGYTTVGRNVATNTGGGLVEAGGATFEVFQSVVASNFVRPGGTDTQCSGSFLADFNVVSGAPGCTALTGGTNVNSVDSIIEDLDSNGGPTKTIELSDQSPAVGFIANGCPRRDQRGLKRPKKECDAGAFEDDPKK